jgi:hypothetical protein
VHIHRFALTASLALAVGIAGCGGGSAGGTTAGTESAPDPTALFKAKLNPVLTDMESTAKDAVAALRKAPTGTAAQAAAAFDGLHNSWQGELSRLEDLDAPSPVESQYASASSAAASVNTDLFAVASAARANRTAEAKGAALNLVNDLAATKAASVKLEQALSDE